MREINCKPAKDAWLVDVSCMGARLDTTAALGPNTPVKFTVVLPDGETELVVNGRVIWMRPVFSSRGRFHQGIQFYGINWDLDRLAKMEDAQVKPSLISVKYYPAYVRLSMLEGSNRPLIFS